MSWERAGSQPWCLTSEGGGGGAGVIVDKIDCLQLHVFRDGSTLWDEFECAYVGWSNSTAQDTGARRDRAEVQMGQCSRGIWKARMVSKVDFDHRWSLQPQLQVIADEIAQIFSVSLSAVMRPENEIRWS